EPQPHWVAPATDGERVDLARRPMRRDRGTHLQHVRPQHLGWGQEIVRVVLHERTASVEARSHHLDDAHKDRRLPVTFRSEAVAILHQPLHGDTGKLAERAEILESVGEGLKTASLKEGA